MGLSYGADYFHRIYKETNRLIVYRNISNNSVVRKMRGLLGSLSQEKRDPLEIDTLMYDFVYLLLKQTEENYFPGNVWRTYLLHLLATDENPFSRAAEKLGTEFFHSSLHKAVIHDLRILYDLANLDLGNFNAIGPMYNKVELNNYQPTKAFSPLGHRHYRENFSYLSNAFAQKSTPEKLVDELARFYYAVGCGEMGLYSAFRWEEKTGLHGIRHPDPVTLPDLIGYAQQKEIVIKNTAAFVQGKPGNNLLLYGERGTGKSTTIKALANRFAPEGLRLVEVPKQQLASFSQIMDKLRGRAQRFIIFIDDLSFESHETEYKDLKALLEGGLESKPENVLIYATSNRRHLIQENWGDRIEVDNEIHIMDAVQEKMSLADRFAITVTYTSPDQEQYLQIVDGLARKYGIRISAAELRNRALKWERWNNARSGRTAQQFINHLLGEQEVGING